MIGAYDGRCKGIMKAWSIKNTDIEEDDYVNVPLKHEVSELVKKKTGTHRKETRKETKPDTGKTRSKKDEEGTQRRHHTSKRR